MALVSSQFHTYSGLAPKVLRMLGITVRASSTDAMLADAASPTCLRIIKLAHLRNRHTQLVEYEKSITPSRAASCAACHSSRAYAITPAWSSLWCAKAKIASSTSVWRPLCKRRCSNTLAVSHLSWWMRDSVDYNTSAPSSFVMREINLAWGICWFSWAMRQMAHLKLTE